MHGIAVMEEDVPDALPNDSDEDIMSSFGPQHIRQCRRHALRMPLRVVAPKQAGPLANLKKSQRAAVRGAAVGLQSFVAFRVPSLDYLTADRSAAIDESRVAPAHCRGGLRLTLPGFLRSVWG